MSFTELLLSCAELECSNFWLAASVPEARAANTPVCFCASSAVHSIFSSGFDSAKMMGLSHCTPMAFRISSVNRGPAAATPTITVGLICSRNNKIYVADLSDLTVLRSYSLRGMERSKLFSSQNVLILTETSIL